jgi:hypothetical protein
MPNFQKMIFQTPASSTQGSVEFPETRGVSEMASAAPQEETRIPTVLPPKRGKGDPAVAPKGLRIGMNSNVDRRGSGNSNSRAPMRAGDSQGNLTRIQLSAPPSEPSGGLVVVREAVPTQNLLQQDLRWGIAKRNPWKIIASLVVIGSTLLGFQTFKIVTMTSIPKVNPIVEDPKPNLMEGFIIPAPTEPKSEALTENEDNTTVE